MSSKEHRESKNGEYVGETMEKTMLMRTQESSENNPYSRIVQRKDAEPIATEDQDTIFPVEVLVDGEHVLSGSKAGKIRRWRIEDGREVGTPMDLGSAVLSIAVSRDGKWIVSGTKSGWVTVWNAESHSKMTEFRAHNNSVRADVSLDATKIATGSKDNTACVWSLSTGQRLLGPWKHDNYVATVKFSPDGCLIATATWDRNSVRVYDSQNDNLFVEFPVKVCSSLNYSLAWASDSKQLFVLSHDSYIHRVGVSTGTTLSKWYIHSGGRPTSVALASNEIFIAAAAGTSVSFWDITSEEQLGTIVEYTHKIFSLAMTSNYDLAAGGGEKITLRALCGILPSHYLDNVSVPA